MFPTRSSIPRGSAIIQFGGETFYGKDEIKLAGITKTNEVRVSSFGKIDERDDEVAHRITFTADGRFSALSVLLPYATKQIGTSVFGTDSPLTLWTAAGKKRVYRAGAITKMPNVILASNKTIWNDLEFTLLHGEGTERSDEGSLYTETDEAYPGDDGYDAADIIMQPYNLSWYAAFAFTADAATDVCTTAGIVPPDGTRLRLTNAGGALPTGLALATDYFVRDRTDTTFKLAAAKGGAAIDITTAGTGTHTATPAGLNNFTTKEGTQLNFSMQTNPETNDFGLYDYTFGGLDVSAQLTPEGMTVQDLDTALLHQGSGSKRGRSLGQFAQDLNITGTGVYVRLYKAALTAANLAFGGMSRNIGDCEWKAMRGITAGVPDPLFYVGTSAPV